MRSWNSQNRWLRRSGMALAALLLATTVINNDVSAGAAGRSGAVTAWARRNALPLATVNADAPLDDLLPIAGAIGDAAVVGLGESAHGAAEELTLKHRMVRLLVEHLGFRSLAWEEDWTVGVEINDYILGGPGDLDELMTRVSSQYQFEQVADVLRWLRDFNTDRLDPVRFFGVEHYFTRQLAYDHVESYVRGVAPERLDELNADLDPIQPTSDDPIEHIGDYRALEDKQPHSERAHAVYELVASLPHESGDRAHALAVHAARQIVRFYEFHSLPFEDGPTYREVHAAESLRWWQQLTGDRVVYWAATPHTANAPDMHLAESPETGIRFPSAGSHLRRWYGDSYRSIGFTLDHGRVAGEPGSSIEFPPARSAWFEHPLSGVRHDQFALDLRRPAPPPVRSWLHHPLLTRGLADAGPDAYIDGGSVAQWFDLLVHRQRVTAAVPAPPAAAAT